MTRSLLSRLPDIFAGAAVRSSEAMHALGLKPGQCLHDRVAVTESDAPPAWRFHAASDVTAVLGLLAGQSPFPRLRAQLGLLWLSSLPTTSLGLDGQAASHKRDASLLSDFAHRLLLARELLGPSALVAVECTPGLEEGLSLVMQTVFGQRPIWTKVDERLGAPQVLLSPVGAADNVWSHRFGQRQGQRSSLLHWLRDAPLGCSAALALGPTLDLSEVWRAWRGRWVVTHPDAGVLAQLQQQTARLRKA